MKLCFEAVGLLVHRDPSTESVAATPLPEQSCSCTIHCTSSNTYVFACVIQVVASGKWPHTGLSAPVRDAFITLRDAVADNTPLRMLNRSLPAHVRADSSVVACGGEIGQFDPWTGVGRSGSTTTPSRRRRAVTLRTCSSTSPTRSPCSVTRISSGTVTSSAGATTTTSSMTTDLTTPRFCASP